MQGLKVLAIDGGKEKGTLCTDLGADVYVDFTSTKVSFSRNETVRSLYSYISGYHCNRH